MSGTVDDDPAGTADPFATVVIKLDGILSRLNELLIQDIQQFKE